MRLVYLAGANSIHTVRWANAMAGRGHQVELITVHDTSKQLHPSVRVTRLPVSPPLGYLANARTLRKACQTLSPDILHAHYASGYGTLGRLSGFRPYVLSVWGADVYDFPRRSALHRKLLMENLYSADQVCSTSHTMASHVKKNLGFTGDIAVTPFGVDTQVFKPREHCTDRATITIGTIKTLSPKYGIDVLIKAFADLRLRLADSYPLMASKLRLLIVGDGPQREQLALLVRELRVFDVTTFVGSIPHTEVPAYLHQIDIFTVTSRSDSESFGVAAVEASACSLPIVASAVGGLPEAVIDGQTGLIVPRDDVDATVQALMRLVLDEALRTKFGQTGRDRVCQLFDWDRNVSLMEAVYYTLLKRRHS